MLKTLDNWVLLCYFMLKYVIKYRIFYDFMIKIFEENRHFLEFIV